MMQRVYDYLKKAGTYYIATMDGDQPRVRIFDTVHIFEGKLYIQTLRSRRVSGQIAKNPKVELCSQNGDGKWEWIRVAGTLVEDNRIEVQQAIIDAFPGLEQMIQAGDGNTQTFYFKDATATISSFESDPVVIKF